MRGLPPRYATLEHGGVYAVVGVDDEVLDSLVLRTLMRGASMAPSMLAATQPIKTMLARAKLRSDVLRNAVGEARLTLLAHHGAPGGPSEFVSGLLEDFHHVGLASGTFVIVDGAQCLFGPSSDSDAKVLASLRNWAEDVGVTCLLVCRASSALPRLVDSSRQLAGLACIQPSSGQFKHSVFHWFTTSGMAGAQTFEIEIAQDASIAVVDDQLPEGSGQEPSGDERVVVAARPAVQASELAPVDWIICDDLPSLTLRAASAVAATVVLPFTGAAGFERLAKAVYFLRKNCGNHLKIVVREINFRLRYSQEALIMRLGANMVIPAELGFARLRSMLAVVQNQVFSHRLGASFEQAMLDSAPEFEQGYLAPSDFVQASLAILQASQRLGLQDILVRLPLGYGLQPLDALRYCAIKREGDLCTADDAHVYVLLHACRESDIALTLERLFKLPVAELFTSETSYMSVEQIKLALDDLQVRHDLRRFVDLSAELAALPHTETGKTRTSKAAPPVRPGEIRYRAPAPAQRRPLKVHGVLTLVETEVQA